MPERYPYGRPHPAQVEAYRRMTPAKKLQQIEELYWHARALKAAGVRASHPDWPEAKVQDEVRSLFLHGAT